MPLGGKYLLCFTVFVDQSPSSCRTKMERIAVGAAFVLELTGVREFSNPRLRYTMAGVVRVTILGHLENPVHLV